MSTTVLDRIAESLKHALAYNVNAEVPPVVLLWPDRRCEFRDAVERVRPRLRILTLGDHDEAKAQGSAYWLRCAIAGTVDVDAPAGIPIVYLPGVERSDLRAIKECPRELAPIAEQQYRGAWFSHPNGRDWTLRSFLVNADRGLGLSVSESAATSEALASAFPLLLDLPLPRLASQHIDAQFLQHLVNPDPVARMLEWLDAPVNFRARVDPPTWKAFSAQAQGDYGFDPAAEGEVTGGRLLGEREGSWSEVWRRYAEAPERYPGVEERLRMGKPTDRLFAGPPGAWPQENEEAEGELRQALSTLEGAPPEQARKSVKALWEEHRVRRAWVWARLERAPLVFALEQLERLGRATATGPSGGVDELASTYAASGWNADDAFLTALQSAGDVDDRQAVACAATALYRPWLDGHARALQEAIGPMTDSATYTPGSPASTKSGTVTVFVDGLRLDLAHRLLKRLDGLDAEISTALSALPTITETSKPVLTPTPEGALGPGQELGPVRASSGAKATIVVLRSLMAERGVQVLQGAETGDPTGCAWTEIGEIDGRGHEFQVALVDDIDTELDRVAKRIKLLLDAGWVQVDVVTDHGWLLLPGGLEKVDLAPAMVEKKKGRCARLKQGATVSVPTVPWYWDKDVQIALAPGVTCFEANQEYEHGGVSLQECVVPRLQIRTGAEASMAGGATITRVKWMGLMCRISFENVAPGAMIDIRGMPGNASTSVAGAAKEAVNAGTQSLFVSDEDLQGEKAYAVIVGADGSILAQREVTIGANQ